MRFRKTLMVTDRPYLTPFLMQNSSPFAIPGRTERLYDLDSQYVLPRNVDVWLPTAYDEAPDSRFPVLYMHDGQNLFYPELSSMGETWQVAETVDRMASEGKIANCIVVGIWNTRRRFREYCPGRPFAQMPAAFKSEAEGILGKAKMLGDEYVRFLMNELKPLIDSQYRTLTDRRNTLVMGSSMGGLISLYAMLEYPELIGGVGCLSTHWPLSDQEVPPVFTDLMGDLIRRKLRPGAADPSGKHRVYFDYGTETLDAIYEPYQNRIDQVMEEMGFSEKEWKTMKFPGHAHTEPDWAQRLHHPLQFLLGI